MSDTSTSKKIILLELDIGQQQSVWFNYSAFTYYVDFDAVYDRIDPAFLNGVSAQLIDNVGSVSSDAAALRQALSVAAVQNEEATFYHDAASKRVYIHLIDGDRPSLHRLVIGIVYGFTNHAGFYGGSLYEGRLLSAPEISKSRDPLFWGMLEFGGGTVTINNADGDLDRIAEDRDLFGNKARALLGFDEESRDQYRPLCTYTIGKAGIGVMQIAVDLADNRRYLATRVPNLVFSTDDYPNLKSSNQGKSISIGYGVLRNVPAMCTNEAEDPAPATFNFKLLDTTFHAIKAIDTVRVDGVAITPSSTNLTNATFSLAMADYDPGQKVTADIQGYKDGSGNLIENALDVIVDLIANWIGIPYSATAYDQAGWAAARISAPDICYYADKPIEISAIIEQICATVLGLFLVDRRGLYNFRIINDQAYPVQIIEGWQILEEATIDYDPTEVLGVVLVGYNRDWSEDESLYLRDDSHRTEVLERYKLAPEKTFDTLLKDATAAQAFSGRLMSIASTITRKFSILLMIGTWQFEIGDIIEVRLTRRDGRQFIGTARAEVISISYNLLEAEQELGCRIVEMLMPSVYVEGEFYGDRFYGDSFYGTSGEVAA